jgi:AraC-like DNA-binding protein
MQSDFSLLATCCTRWEINHDVHLCSILQTTLIHLLMEMSIEQNKTPEAQPISQQKQQVQKIMSFIDTHYFADLTLEKISEASFLSKYYITRIFKRVTGYSILEYIHQKRVSQAQNLLVETDLEIVEIALRCGFNNLSNFYHVFGKAVGMTPMYYRKHYGRHPVLN